MKVDCAVLYKQIDSLADQAIAQYESTSDHYFEGVMDAFGVVLGLIEEMEKK